MAITAYYQNQGLKNWKQTIRILERCNWFRKKLFSQFLEKLFSQFIFLLYLCPRFAVFFIYFIFNINIILSVI